MKIMFYLHLLLPERPVV